MIIFNSRKNTMAIEAANSATSLLKPLNKLTLFKLANQHIRQSHKADFIGMSSYCQPSWVSLRKFLEGFAGVHSRYLSAQQKDILGLHVTSSFSKIQTTGPPKFLSSSGIRERCVTNSYERVRREIYTYLVNFSYSKVKVS